MKYNLYILSYDKKVKLYWNRMLQAWVQYKGNASPYSKEELGTRPLPFQIEVEEVEAK